jgi:hypothetical protein
MDCRAARNVAPSGRKVAQRWNLLDASREVSSGSECRVRKYERPFVVIAVLMVSAICDGWAVADLVEAGRASNEAQNMATVKTVPDFRPQELQSDRSRWVPGLHVFSLSEGLPVERPGVATVRDIWRPVEPVHARF